MNDNLPEFTYDSDKTYEDIFIQHRLDNIKNIDLTGIKIPSDEDLIKMFDNIELKVEGLNLT